MIIRPTRYVPQGHPAPIVELFCVDCGASMKTIARGKKRCDKCLPAHIAKLAKKNNERHAAKNKAARRAKA